MQLTSTSGSTPAASVADGVSNVNSAPAGLVALRTTLNPPAVGSSSGIVVRSIVGAVLSSTLMNMSRVLTMSVPCRASHCIGVGPAGSLSISRPTVEPSAGAQVTSSSSGPTKALTRFDGIGAPSGPVASNVVVSPARKLNCGETMSSSFTNRLVDPVFATCDANMYEMLLAVSLGAISCMSPYGAMNRNVV